MDDFLVLEEVVERPKIPDGEVLQAEVLEVKRQTKPWKDDDGKDVEKISFKFKITEDGPYKDQFVWGETSTAFNSGSECRLRIWVQELLGEDDLPKGFKLDLGSGLLDGLSCRVAIGQRQNQTTKKVYVFVSDVMRSNRVPTAAEVF